MDSVADFYTRVLYKTVIAVVIVIVVVVVITGPLCEKINLVIKKTNQSKTKQKNQFIYV